ncbi:hypothetical protein MYBA111488_00600 [Mycobacterium basiliense]
MLEADVANLALIAKYRAGRGERHFAVGGPRKCRHIVHPMIGQPGRCRDTDLGLPGVPFGLLQKIDVRTQQRMHHNGIAMSMVFGIDRGQQ